MLARQDREQDVDLGDRGNHLEACGVRMPPAGGQAPAKECGVGPEDGGEEGHVGPDACTPLGNGFNGARAIGFDEVCVRHTFIMLDTVQISEL